ncbi:BTB/POZ domain-containing protein 2-like isoform X2 [Macrosteles quadrilineatus]|uniref:BTB/POZ domain-containing protein 2-like isoform X2 n=1 Tax=Macrosteles quadrilineatus TaxID=74068 RepID=UPI0023E25B7C|nr:BTB/POZ domain-containing protein 2-like isoform X2 [Macrosteles quadrilineatus]XP_054278627.1 BTB/POZ domain-containing protein 2-like isoform X2 [Macrosteles quadrilineatus]
MEPNLDAQEEAGPSTSSTVQHVDVDPLPMGAADYLFSRETLHDCHFRVGNAEDIPVETLGAVKAMLLAHSPVFRNMLQESDLREDTRKIINLPDVHPDAFKLLLKYVYNSLDEPLDLSRDMAMKLFFAADKYLIEPLRKKAINQLIPRTVDEVFPALYCLTLCTTGIDCLENIVKTVVQTRTTEIFNCQQFLELNSDCLVFILKQPILNCREVEVWKASVKWAEHQGQTSEGQVLRQILKEPLKYIRLCTMTNAQVFSEVAPKNILTDSETLKIVRLITTNDMSEATENDTDFCMSRLPRRMSDRPFNVPSWGSYFDLGHKMYVGDEKGSGCRLDISDYAITLKSIACRGKKSPFSEIDFLTSTRKYRCVCKVILSIYDNDVLKEVCVIDFDQEVNYEEEFIILTMYQGNYWKLACKHVYRIHLEFREPHPRWCSNLRDGEPLCSEHHFDGGWLDCYWSCNHIVRLHYTRHSSNRPIPMVLMGLYDRPMV